MEIKKIQLSCDDFLFTKIPMPVVTEQRLTINNQGRFWYSEWKSGINYEKPITSYQSQASIGKTTAKEILELFEAAFTPDFIPISVNDGRDWHLTITYVNETTSEFASAIGYEIKVFNRNLSEYLRQTLKLENLYLFDGKGIVD